MNANPQPHPAGHLPWSALNLAQLQAEMTSLGEPTYRARQLDHALRGRGASSWDGITDLPAGLRAELASRRQLRSLSIAAKRVSRLDGSVKLVLEAADGGLIESVLMFARTGGSELTTACISSQIGCPAACVFCASGLGGFSRNLTVAEIVDQVAFLSGINQGRRVDNVVFMGMGEPFLNYRRVIDVIRTLRAPSGYGIGARHITVSTVGIVPAINRFAEDGGEVNLAVSLHAPNDDLRDRLVPYNRRYPIAELLAAVKSYVERTHRRVTFEYVLLEGSNDLRSLAVELARLLRPLKPLAHVNLIPWNPFPEAGFSRATRERAEAFARTVRNGGVNTTIRFSKGLDIDAACGQLRRKSQAEAVAS